METPQTLSTYSVESRIETGHIGGSRVLPPLRQTCFYLSEMKFQISTPPYDSVLLLQLKDRLEICEAHLEKGSLALDLPRAKQSLAHHEEQLKDIENSAMRTFCRGEELIDFLKQSEIELRVKDPVTLENIDAQTHIYNLLEVLHSKRRDLRDLAEERKIKLEQNLLLRQLESDAKQVSPKFSF